MAGLFLPRLSRELVNRKKRVLQSVVAIVKIATGRETLLIGPSAAFGANARRHLIRDRNRLRHKLDVFMTRPGAADLVRPYLRRWGLHWAHSRLSERETIKDALLRAAASGQLAIAVVPETTLALAAMRPAENDFARAARLAQQPAGDALPNAIVDRVAIVLEMVPRYLTGAAKKAFEDAVASIGIGVMAGIFATWLTAHAVPGVDIALFILDVYFLGSGVIAAFDAITETMRRVANARSRADLEPAAKAVAEAITALVVAGIFHKLMKAREPARGPGKEGGLQVVEKPGSGPKELKAVRESRRPNVTSETHKGESPGSKSPTSPTSAAPSTSASPPTPATPVLVEKYQRAPAASLSNVEARKWYLEQEAKIPQIIDRNASLETQAKQAFNFRNEIRTAARDAMADRDAAAKLMREERNITWEQLVEKKRKEGFTGDDVYREIINSSQKSRKSVNDKLGL